ncbi:bifunctional tRNA (5-methylaminomethyl-2-thiouridine)(34)-methyltransferase MnmD/FAD-dependent 5-carboxymethylaminomethyl-2-thiouridine(34) oxidoreductase MnmC [Photobacterium damselae subsp. piscicida]|uniref:bifunctional tRNA (5-methylaminomethyl-2-thiouridine)(34)-methyltransferase MnmD/FAD-dependent 5-carboxymethylaminomethyl-2-thiouridine(34) oxidoreductase MnmC n=1 Tax=Photobacterium damselae TaxID=38293 RepID=UPI0002E70469|nr:bifunctional tRNA (5-methylaminomethyl-2-thiouridine)(34)-methyltransferase MnmD/FAD-dependent 5-carboxymethylaminomethyl-2-thiouridine(34) oxidoreductase MnmC [Photobacterium damselae]OLQ82435.1 bifunctional tRNA (5-methylaminomethyl-2-thiouridine)(34)-methyltransferase MnmD/FAD-dependent 5-carboxymethylaminomethyl-2-thiouridine(34) oxidoreductase MnmC [Photobacterium damselae subsp. piscicida]TFZ54214.1 bifunctional tRNA (5-methylaminomethyl-2-thiouridine)(34)-methyltransferase MnmD/FAD-depe
MSTQDTNQHPAKIENAVLDWNELGTPVSNDFDDVYFSNANGLEETRYVFLQQNGLPDCWNDFSRRRFVVAETGFGTGLNFLALWQQFKAFRAENPDATVKELHFISFEKFPVTLDDLKKAHLSWPELSDLAQQLHAHYPPAVADCHRIILEDGLITLDLWFGDIQDCMPQVWTGDEGIVDAWFLDGFAPSKNLAMWNLDVYKGMRNLARSGCTLATFTAAGFVRRELIEAGFEMKKAKGFGHKREMLTGTIGERTAPSNTKPWYHISARAENDTAQTLNDIAIIGGGVASAATALSLVRRGQTVTLYCKDEKSAQGASGNKQGAVYPLLNGNHNALSRFFAPAFVFARQFVEQAAKNSQFDHDWCGVVQLAFGEDPRLLDASSQVSSDGSKEHQEKRADMRNKQRIKLDKMLAGGFPNELICALDHQQTREVTGVETGFDGANYPLGGWLCPKELTRALIEQAQATGLLTLHTQSEVCKLQQESDQRWQLQFSDGQSKQHACVVIANGHRFTDFEQTAKIPAYSVRGQVSHIPTNEQLGKLKTVLCYDGYLTPENPHSHTHCIGASYNRNSVDLAFSKQNQHDNRQRLIDCLPQAEWAKSVDVSDNQARVGVRCATRDHLPFMGNVCRYDELLTQYENLKETQASADKVPVYNNLFALIGLGSRGLSSAPLVGEMMASQICGDPLPMPLSVLEALHPGRMWVRKLVKGKAL